MDQTLDDIDKQIRILRGLGPTTNCNQICTAFNQLVGYITRIETECEKRNYMGLIAVYGCARDALCEVLDRLLSKEAADDAEIMIASLNKSIETEYREFESRSGFGRN